MARTLTAGATTWKAGFGYAYDWLVESSALSMHLSFSEELAGGFTWEHSLISISEIEQSVPPGGGVGSAQTVTIQVAEKDTGQTLRALWNTYGKLEGADLTVSLLPAGEAYADRIELFTGTIDSVSWTGGTEIGRGIGTIIASDKTLQVNPLLPMTVINTEDFPNAPESTIGLVLAMLYGSNIWGTANSPLAPLIPVDSTLAYFKLAGHPVDDEGTGAIVAVASSENTQVTTIIYASGVWNAGDAALTLGSPITELEFQPGGPTLSVIRESSVTGSANAIDGADSPSAYIGTTGTDAYGNGVGYLGIKASQASISASNVAKVTVTRHKREAGGDTTTLMRFAIRAINANTNAVTRDPLYTSQDFRHQSGYLDTVIRLDSLALPSDAALEVFIEAINEGAPGGADERWEVGEVDIDLYFQAPSEFYPFFSAGWEGLEDNDGDITGTAGNVIKLAADVIRSVIVDHMELTVDTTSFDDARTTILDYSDGSYDLCFGVGSGGWYHERVNAVQLLDELLQQSKSYVFPAGDGTLKIIPYRYPQAFEESVFEETEFETEEGSGSSFAYEFTESEILNLTVDMSQPELITNSFEVRYAWLPHQQRFSQRAYANPSGSNVASATVSANVISKCTDSYARYGDRRHLVIDAYALRDQIEAETLLQHYVDYFWTQLITVEFETTFVGVHLEVGDFVTITHPELPDNEDGQTYEIIRLTHVPEVKGSRPMPIRIKALTRNRLGFTYFCLKDQTDVIWCYYVNTAGELVATQGTPSVTTRFATSITPGTVPYWLEIDNPAPTTRYVHPLVTGELYVATSAPAVGTGVVGSPTWRGTGWPLTDYQIELNALDEVIIVAQ